MVLDTPSGQVRHHHRAQSVAQTKEAFEFVARYGWIAFFAFPLVLFLIAVILKRRGDPVNAE